MKFRFGLVKKSPKKGSLRTIFVQHFFSVFAKIQKFSRVKSQKTFSKKIVLREPFFGDFFWRLFLETFLQDLLVFFATFEQYFLLDFARFFCHFSNLKKI